MEFKQIYVCKQCHSFYTVNPEKSSAGCPECGSRLIYVPYSISKYNGMTDQEKESFQAEVLQNTNFDHAIIASAPREEPEPEEGMARGPHDPHASGWVIGMKFANKLVFAFFLIAAIAAFVLLLPNPLVAVIAAGLLLCIGFLLVGMSMVFLELATDIRAIRDHMEQ